MKNPLLNLVIASPILAVFAPVAQAGALTAHPDGLRPIFLKAATLGPRISGVVATGVLSVPASTAFSGGTLSLGNSTSSATVNLNSGFLVSQTLSSLNIGSGSVVFPTAIGPVAPNAVVNAGNSLIKTGAGSLAIGSGSLNLSGGTLVINGGTAVVSPAPLIAPAPAPVPEPGSAMLLAIGALALGQSRRPQSK